MLKTVKSVSMTLASVVTGVVALVLLLARLLGWLGGWGWLCLPVIIFATVAIASHRLVTRRVHFAIDDLRKIERREFGTVAPGVAGNDELSELRSVIGTTGKTLESEITAMRRLESYRRDYLGNVSHELKTPIFSIRGFAETLRDGALERPGVRESFVDKIIRNADRLSNLAQDLTEIAKIETGELKMHTRPFDIASMIQDVVESVEPRARNKEMQVEVDVEFGLPKVIADESRIRQVVSNLVENGIKYTNPGGTITVTVRRDADAVAVTVRDNGIGIAPEHQTRITERFYRVDASRSREQGGTGLGLAIVKHILNAHGQRLELDSALGKGSSFAFRLPIQDSTPKS